MTCAFPGRRAVSGLLLAAMVVCAIVNAGALVKLRQLEERMSVEVEESIIWSATQAETELMRLLATARAAAPGDRDALARLRRRFDIFWSRLAVFGEGVLADWLARTPELAATVPPLQAELDRLDPAVRALPADAAATRAAIVARLEPFAGGLRRIAVASVHEDRRERADLRALHDQQRGALLASALGFAGTTGALVAFLLANVSRVRGLWRVAEQARGEAEQARSRLEEAIENVDEGFVLFDGNDRLVLCNRKYQELYGGFADVIRPGAHFADIARSGAERGLVTDAVGRVDDWVVERLEQRRHGGAAFEQALSDGRWLLVSDRPTREGGFVGIRADITELKRRELALEEARERLDVQAREMRALAEHAEEASAAKSDFLAMMSHEIRTPMNGVLGALGLLADHVRRGEPARLLATARQSGEALLGLLNDILDLSKAEAGRLDLEVSAFDPRALALSVVELARIQAHAKGLALDLASDDAVPPRVRGDPGRVRQMLMNLVSNAVKFTAEGRIAVRLSPAPGRDERLVRFEVIDDGIGIPADRHDEVFGDFAQLEPAARRRGGTGLGLAITRRLAELMGGRVAFASAEGCGSRFWFDLPLSAAAAPTTAVDPAADDVTPFAARPRVLIAEDNSSNQLILKAMLERLNVHVDVVADGAEAVATAASLPYDAAVLDLAMPVMDGRAAACRLRADGFTAPILAATANADRREAAELRRAAFDGVLVKPLDRAALKRALAAAWADAAVPVPAAAIEVDGSDTGVLATLRRDLDAATFRQVVAGAAADLEEAGRAFDDAAAAGDDAAARRAAHRLAGVAVSMGASALAGRARAVEIAGLASPEAAALDAAVDAAATRLRGLIAPDAA